ncbi:hypothetical protein HC030_30010 [Planosporangium mesophilum]|nr:hypothetical protein [Planosporangium mesophilum]
MHFRLRTAVQQECTATTDPRGTAACTVTVNQPPAPSVPLVVSFDGNRDVLGSKVTATLKLQTPTTLTYTGPHAVANGESVALSAVLKDFAGGAVAGRTVDLSIGSGVTRQGCTATTAQDGAARCVVPDVRQPLNGAATGSTTLTVTVGGVPIVVPTAPNSVVALPGGTTLIVNE